MIFGDSLLVINWVTGKIRIHNLDLSQIILEVIRISNLFEYVDFKHIYREINTIADELASVGAKVQNGYWHISEFQGNDRIDTSQMF